MSDFETFEWPWLGRIPGAIPRSLGGRALVGGRGMVVAPQPLAAEAGVAVLRGGGNAVDAAVATSAMLMVTAPMQCGPGGDAIWLIQSPGSPAVVANGTGRSGRRCTLDAARILAGRDGERGGWTVTVPGAVASWVSVLQRFGTRSLEELLQPAIETAESGFFVSRFLSASLTVSQSVLRQTEEGIGWYLASGVPPIYSRLRNPELARCLRTIAATDGEALYRGEIAEAIAETVVAAEGFLDAEDLAEHATQWDDPLRLEIDNLEILEPPPNSQGVTVLESLKLTASVLARPFPKLDDADDVHVLIEALRASLADRDALVADPVGQPDVPEQLLNGEYLAARAGEIDRARAASDWEPGVGPLAPSASSRQGDTANLVVVDENRLAVALTQSLYYDFGSGLPVRGWGFTLHNRGSCFSLSADAPNAVGPVKRPLHTLIPGMALEDGRIRYVFGCMGGHGQAQTQAQLLARLAAGDDAQEAVAGPRFFVNPEGSYELYVEARTPASVQEGLLARGHPLKVLGDWEEIMGHAQLITVEPSGALVGGGDPRTDGHVAAW